VINANFFWHGPALTRYEAACLASFMRYGIEVRMHTFNASLRVPDGVKVVDAGRLARPEEVLAYTQGGHKQSVAAFTDIFRYRVLAQEPGWWFDTDVFCLKDADHYLDLQRRSKGLLVGVQEDGELNGAVMYVSDTAIARELEYLAQKKGFEFDWGDIGPRLVTQYEAKNRGKVTLVGQQWFYPVHYLETELFFLPEAREGCTRLAKDAVCVHLWNEFLRRWRVPKNVPPCEGSYLHSLFAQVECDANENNLPLDTFLALRGYGGIGRVGHSALRSIATIKSAKERIFGR
jgi:hypothetical protein